MRAFALTFLLVALFAFPAAPGLAQNTNPTPDPGCGLPKGLSGARRIYSSVTYTLTADCQQEWRLSCDIPTTSEDAAAIITINGGGHTITAFCDDQGCLDVIRLTAKCALNLNNVTINRGGYQGTGAVQLTNSDVASSFSNVTFSNTYYNALHFSDQREDSPGTTHTLSNVLIKDTDGSYAASAHGHPSGIQAIGKVNLNINNLALRNVHGGNSAIGANDTYIVGRNVSKGRITLTGCLTIDGVFPRVWYGDIDDGGITGPCSGTVGNGGSAAMQYPQAPESDCGLPLSGFIYGKHVYNLKSDCALTGPLYIPYESDVVINGEGFTIDAAAAGEEAIAVAGDFSLKTAVISGAAGSPLVSYLVGKTMSIADATFRNNMGPLRFQDSIVTLARTLIENHSVSNAARPSGVSVEKSAQVTICDSDFRGNTGGVGALHAGARFTHGDPSTTLAGAVTFESNTPTDIHDPDSLLRDNRGGACPNRLTSNPAAKPADGTSAQHNPPPGDICDGKPGALPMGAVACVFRHAGELAVYGLDERSRGFFMAAATQAQINALGAGMIAASPDGRAAIFAAENGDVIVSVGPDHEGKVLHLRLESGLHGRAINLRTTYGGPPSLGFAAVDQARTNALTDCMVTTNYILNFRDAPAGNIKYLLPYDVTLTAFERAADWFYVDYHGDRGWIHADYARSRGNCG